MYDFLIIGGGPSGLTLSYLLSRYGYNCILIEKQAVLGGCHRVLRVSSDHNQVMNKNQDLYFTEHGPRIYSSAYLNTIHLLHEMNYPFLKHFQPYHFSISHIQGNIFKNLSFRELMWLTWEFLKLIGGTHNYLSMRDFCQQHQFSPQAQDYIDRLCRLTDGAAADRYTIFEFLQLLNQQYFYQLFQPSLPNDQGLVKVWTEHLQRQQVKILVNTSVEKIKSYADYVEIQALDDHGLPLMIQGKNCLLALPPPALSALIDPTTWGAPWDQSRMDEHTYLQDIPVIFHWDKKLDLPAVWGFPGSDWGVAFIVLSNYMNFENPHSLTVISTCVTRSETPSSWTKKTAHESSPLELKAEIFRQLQISFPALPPPTQSLIDPLITYKSDLSRYVGIDSAFVSTPDHIFIPPQNTVWPRIFNVGTQNGFHTYNFTSFESAVQNALALVHQIVPKSRKQYPILKPKSLTTIIRKLFWFTLVWVIMGILIWIFFRVSKKKIAFNK